VIQIRPTWTLLAMLVAGPVLAQENDIVIEEAWIPMPDGVRLAADLYRPADAEPDTAYPVLLEYLPYRKTEARARNYSLYSYFIERGYVVARVDIRGTGNSEGRLIPHEYSDIEHEDGEVVIDWLSKQPFSNGNVGMFGISWGGFNAIQMAVRQPPALKAIIAVDATEDLYQDDVHYMDGIMHVDSWEMSQDLDNARPGAPDYVIDEAYFENRFDTEPWMLTYKAEQRDGPFWDGASARDRYDELAVPMYHIGGWYDGYRDSLPRMLASADVPQSDGHTQVQFDSGFTQQLRERQVRGTADVAREEVVELHAGELRGNWFEIAFGHTLTVFAEAFPALVHDVVE